MLFQPLKYRPQKNSYKTHLICKPVFAHSPLSLGRTAPVFCGHIMPINQGPSSTQIECFDWLEMKRELWHEFEKYFFSNRDGKPSTKLGGGGIWNNCAECTVMSKKTTLKIWDGWLIENDWLQFPIYVFKNIVQFIVQFMYTMA